jgi:hypothetical protein
MAKLASNLYWIRLLSGEPRKKFAERIGTSDKKILLLSGDWQPYSQQDLKYNHKTKPSLMPVVPAPNNATKLQTSL